MLHRPQLTDDGFAAGFAAALGSTGQLPRRPRKPYLALILLAVVLVAALCLVAIVARPSSVSGTGAPAALAIERTCTAADDFGSVWRTTFNGTRVDLYCGDRLLVDGNGDCWFLYGGKVSPAPCRATPQPRGARVAGA